MKPNERCASHKPVGGIWPLKTRNSWRISSRHLRRGRLEGRDQPHATGQQVNVNLHEVVARARLGQVEEVQGDCAAPAGRGKRIPACGQCSALVRWHVGHEANKVVTSAARCGHQTRCLARAMVLSRPKWPPRGLACSSSRTRPRSPSAAVMHKRSPDAVRR